MKPNERKLKSHQHKHLSIDKQLSFTIVYARVCICAYKSQITCYVATCVCVRVRVRFKIFTFENSYFLWVCEIVLRLLLMFWSNFLIAF